MLKFQIPAKDTENKLNFRFSQRVGSKILDIFLADQQFSITDRGLELSKEEALAALELSTIAQDVRDLQASLQDIDSALDEIIALQDYYTGATFDEIHEYAQAVKEGE